mmetsp:Transcript_3604/g.3796  ORF Transcript_3604/g.3796 Transcript_3604/m.3796 type:complete len:206 (-) Transcript_3604:524-1141(-)
MCPFKLNESRSSSSTIHWALLLPFLTRQNFIQRQQAMNANITAAMPPPMAAYSNFSFVTSLTTPDDPPDPDVVVVVWGASVFPISAKREGKKVVLSVGLLVAAVGTFVGGRVGEGVARAASKSSNNCWISASKLSSSTSSSNAATRTSSSSSSSSTVKKVGCCCSLCCPLPLLLLLLLLLLLSYTDSTKPTSTSAHAFAASSSIC